MFELLPVGVSVLDPDNNVIYVNPALERILGMTHAALLQGNYRQRTYLRKDGTTMTADEFASVRATREREAVFNVETGIVKKTVKWFGPTSMQCRWIFQTGVSLSPQPMLPYAKSLRQRWLNSLPLWRIQKISSLAQHWMALF
ncbi:MAG: PAS domain-containing protein [Anaerolineales bacterium]|nr:PAS domain-containing protein [Anaerolineales bacterium]